MLSMIDEDDLAEFVTETKKQETEQPTVITPQPETKPAVEETEKEPEKESKETNTGALLAIALLAVAGCGGVYYFKVVKPKKRKRMPEMRIWNFMKEITSTKILKTTWTRMTQKNKNKVKDG